MRVRLYAILANVSLLLCVAVLALWVRSEMQDDGRADEWSLMRGRRYFLWSDAGQLRVGVERLWTYPKTPDGRAPRRKWDGLPTTPYAEKWTLAAGPGPGGGGVAFGTRRPFGRIQYGVGQGGPGGVGEWRRVTLWYFPHAAVVAVLAVLPAGRAGWAAARALRRRSRATAGRCAACGYDLRGNVSGTCPECGRKAPAPVST